MLKKFGQIYEYYKTEGVTATSKYIFIKVSDRIIRKLKKNDNSFIFSQIYKNNSWKSQESRSGEGSEISQTKKLIQSLPTILEKFEIKTIIDAPCGDFNWMKHVLFASDIQYIGLDIVSALIKENQDRFGNRQSAI